MGFFQPQITFNLFFITVLTTLLGVQGYKSKTCIYDNHEYFPGSVDIKPCVTCHCDGDTGDFRCSYKECPVQDDPTCIEYATPKGQCCAQCVQHGCDLEGKKYPLGSRIPMGPCNYCYCPWEVTGSGRPTCFKITCAEVSCEGAVIPPGRCCPVCPNGDESSMSFGYDD